MQKIEVSNAKENKIEHFAPSGSKSGDLGLAAMCPKVEDGTVGKWTVSLDKTGCSCPEGKIWKKEDRSAAVSYSCQ